MFIFTILNKDGFKIKWNKIMVMLKRQVKQRLDGDTNNL